MTNPTNPTDLPNAYATLKAVEAAIDVETAIDVEAAIDWKAKFEAAREAFLNMIADSHQWEIEYDADTNSNGMQVDCSSYSIDGPIENLRDICEAFGIRQKYEQSLDDAILEAVEKEPES